jgi:hypothetical protein
MLEVRRAKRRERICKYITNPLEIYDDLELIERFRSMKMLHSMNCTLAIRYYSCMNRYVDIFNLKTRLVVPTTNIYIFDAINQVNCPGNVTHTFC